LGAIGLEVLSDRDAKEFGLKSGSEMFDVTYNGISTKYPMSDSVKEFSFLNRWFIFKRVSSGVAASAVTVPGVPMAAPTVVPGAVPEAPEVALAVPAEVALGVPTVPAVPVALAAPAEVALEALEAPAAQPARTIPTTAIPVARRFEPNEIFLVYGEARLADTLGIKDLTAARWLAPNAPFPIIYKEADGTEIKFPTIDHYLAAMKYIKATNKPELGKTLFAQEGSIHQDFEGKRLIETQAGKRPITEDRDAELLKEESTRVKAEVAPQKMKLYRATYNEAAWATVKDDLLRGALRQRLDRDARFKRIVEAARNKGKYILYYTGPSGASELGGVRKTQTGMIEGENKIGRFIMELANFPAF
jgi:hypothetical protein